MFGSEMMDVAIGIVFTYLLLSLISSAVNEFIERKFKNRASDLERGLRELLNDPDGTNLVQKVYDHGMINGLFKGAYDPKAPDKSNLPSYIPSRNFALAMLGILAPESSGAGAVANFRDAVGHIENVKVKDALAAMVQVAGNDADKLREDIENWFNSTMDRVSGWYKRRSQLIVFVLGFGLAGIMNVNSITIANDLWLHKAQRDALVSAAQGYLEKRSQNAPQTTTPTGKDALQGGEGLDASLRADVKSIESYGLPIGWNVIWPDTPKSKMLFVVVSFLGWLITAFAVSLGAPFWFDVLNKFIVVRSTIKPHEKSLEERSKN